MGISTGRGFSLTCVVVLALAGPVGAQTDSGPLGARFRPLTVRGVAPISNRAGEITPERAPRRTQAQGGSGTLFGDVVRDFGAAFTSTESLRLLGFGLAASSATVLLDDEVAASGFSTELIEGGFLDRFFEPAELMGSWKVQVGGPVVTYVVGRLAAKPGAVDLSRDLIRAQILSQAMTQVIKRSVRRSRPDASGNSSFPSGHTSATFAAATVFHRRYGWKAGVPAFAFATWVATSRLNEQKHWLSDLPFGAAIGLLSGRTVTRELRGWTIAPMVLPGGGGVQVSLGAGR